MESAGLALSIVPLTIKIVKYLDTARGAKEDITSFRQLLLFVKDLIEAIEKLSTGVSSHDSSKQEIEALFGPGGPVAAHYSLLKDIERELPGTEDDLREKHKIRQVRDDIRQGAAWPFKKAKIAEYTRRLMDLLEVLQSQQSRILQTAVSSVSVQIGDMSLETRRAVRVLRSGNLQEACRMISDIDVDSIVANNLSRCQESKPNWILHEPNTKTLLETNGADAQCSPDRVLWANGDPGVGKTTTACFVLDHMKRVAKESVAIIHYFCSTSSPETTDKIIRSFLRQLIQQLEPDSFDSFVNGLVEQQCQSQKLKSPGSEIFERTTLSELLDTYNYKEFLSLIADRLGHRELAKVAMEHFKQVFCLVDGPDEVIIREQRSLMAYISQVSQQTPNLRLLVFSRSNLRPWFSTSATSNTNRRGGFHVFKTIVISARDQDLRSFIQAKLEELITDPVTGETFGPLISDGGARFSLVQKILDKSVGLFLLAERHIKAISHCATEGSLHKTISNLKSDLGTAADQAMTRMKSKGDDRAEVGSFALLWVVLAKRQLTMPELQHAIATCLDDDGRDFNPQAIPQVNTIMDCTEGLLNINTENGVVDMHASSREYFTKKDGHNLYHQFGQDKIRRVAFGGLKYLNYSVFEVSFEHKPDLAKRMPFLDYAGEFWGWHLHDVAGFETECTQPILDLLGHPLKIKHAGFTPWQCAAMLPYKTEESMRTGNLPAAIEPIDEHNTFRVPSMGARNLSAFSLHLAVYFDLCVTTQYLLKHGMQEDTPVTLYSRMLDTAVTMGSVGMIQLLLQYKADIYRQNGLYKRTYLHCATSSGQKDVVEFMLGTFPDLVNKTDAAGRTSLFEAATKGYDDIGRVLLEHHADASITDNTGATALHFAIFNGHQEMVSVILTGNERKLLNLCDLIRGNTPLHAACVQGELEIVKILLAHGADLEARQRFGLLQRNEAELDQGKSPLHLAIDHGQWDVIQLLLNHGAELRSPSGKWNDSALHAASRVGNLKILQLLLSHAKSGEGCLDLRNNTDDTALWIAVNFEKYDCARALVDAGASKRAANCHGQTLFHAAASNYNGLGFLQEHLLSDGDLTKELIDSQNMWGETPLMRAAQRQLIRNVKALCAAGACTDVGTENVALGNWVRALCDD